MNLLRALLCCLLGFAGGAVQAGEPEKVIINADDDYPPYSYVENGDLKGIYVELLRVAAKRLAAEYQVILKPLPWKRALLEVEAGQALAVLPPYFNAERTYIESYSPPLYRESVVLFCNPNVLARAPKKFPDDFSGLVVARNLGFTLGATMSDAVKRKVISVREAPGSEASLLLLHTGAADCYANDRISVHYIVEQMRVGKMRDSSRLAKYKDVPLHEAIVVSTEEAMVGYSRASRVPYKADFIKKLNAVLKDLAAEGTVTGLIRKNFPGAVP
jgi:polar amino acid transport system substrate-binding protein